MTETRRSDGQGGGASRQGPMGGRTERQGQPACSAASVPAQQFQGGRTAHGDE
jgi:hypothetical protein